MFLGQVLDRLGDDAFAAETLLGLGDLPLMVDIEAAGRPFGEDPSAYAANAVRRFTALAGDADWLALMTALERAEDSAATCLDQMLRWSLRQDREAATDCHSHACSCKGD